MEPDHADTPTKTVREPPYELVSAQYPYHVRVPLIPVLLVDTCVHAVFWFRLPAAMNCMPSTAPVANTEPSLVIATAKLESISLRPPLR